MNRINNIPDNISNNDGIIYTLLSSPKADDERMDRVVRRRRLSFGEIKYIYILLNCDSIRFCGRRPPFVADTVFVAAYWRLCLTKYSKFDEQLHLEIR